MQTTEKLHDSLHILFLGFQSNSTDKSPIKSLLLKETATSEMPTEVSFFKIENKYFKSNVELVFHESKETLIEKYQQSQKHLNVLAIVRSREHLCKDLGNSEKLNKIFLSSEENTEAFKSIWKVSEEEEFEKQKFFEEFDCFVLISELSSQKSFQNEENNALIGDFMEDVRNFMWKHEKVKASREIKANKEADKMPKKEEGVGSDPSDYQFMSMFDEIMSFNKVKMQLSPKSRKEQASNLILGLVKSLEEAEGEQDL